MIPKRLKSLSWHRFALAAVLLLGGLDARAQNAAAVAPSPAGVPPQVQILPEQPPLAETEKSLKPAIPPSLFLSPQDQTRIENALSDYQNFLLLKKSDQEQIAQQKDKPSELAAPQQQEQRFYTYPQFFLESLVYHSANDWAVRINGHKILPGEQSKNLKVVLVNNEEVRLQWKPDEMARVLDVWDKVSEPIKMEGATPDKPLKMDFTAPAQKPNAVIVDKDERLVTFTLHPNQTFSSYVMRVLEGKVRPMTVENKTPESLLKAPINTLIGGAPIRGGIAPPTAVAAPPSAAQPPAPRPAPNDIDDSNSGLNGLMKTLEKK